MALFDSGSSFDGAGSAAHPSDPTPEGKYRLVANLGRGGMADVCLAEARSGVGSSKLVVVKRIRTELLDNPRIVAMFHDEARLAVRLNHPNVVHTYEVEERADGACFIIMEYLEGQPLSAICDKTRRLHKPFTARIMLHIVSDALSGLHYAHELRDYDGAPLEIVHRDISPHNIFVTYGGQTKVMDFGIAKAVPNATKTEAGEIKGKLTYMAPEQANGLGMDRRADIFSMGLVLWELLTGRRLMNGETTTEVMNQLLLLPIPRASTLAEGLDPEIDDIVAKALERAPEDRFQSAKEMRDALESRLAARGQLVRAEEIESFLAELFRDVRESDESMIQSQMGKAMRTPPAPDQVTLTTPSKTVTRGGSSPLGLSLQSTQDVHVDRSRPPVERKSRLVLLLTTGAALVLAASALQLVAGRARAPEPTSATAGHREDAVVSAGTSPPASFSPLLSASAPGVAPPAEHADGPLDPASSPHQGSSGEPHARAAPIVRPPVPAPSPAVATPSASASVAEVRAGYLTLDTYPWTRVSENGRELGTTPLVHIALPPGQHTLTLENPDLGIHQTYTATVTSGATLTRRLGLQ